MGNIIIEYDSHKFYIQNGVLLKYLGNDKEVVIPYGVTRIESRAFDNNLSITKVYIPDTVKSYGARAFINCHNLININAPNSWVGVSHCKSVKIIDRRLYDYEKEQDEPELDSIPHSKVSTTDYKQLFLEVAYMKEPQEKENVLDKIFDDDVKIPFAVHLFVCYESPKAKQYIIENSKQVMHYLVDNGDMESISAILPIIKKNKNNKEI